MAPVHITYYGEYMSKYGCMALLAIACGMTMPAAQAKGNFFVAGQAGQATFDDSGLSEDKADTSAFSLGYRWQAGSIVQIGLEAGGGKVDEISEGYAFDDGFYSEEGRVGFDVRYAHLGANARFSFGPDSRWFAIARAGYMGYTQDINASYRWAYNDPFLSDLNGSESSSQSEDGGGAYFGAGLGVDITQNFNINLMFNGYAYSALDEDGELEDDASTASTTTLGLELRF